MWDRRRWISREMERREMEVGESGMERTDDLVQVFTYL
jgi:hypothetical protein